MQFEQLSLRLDVPVMRRQVTEIHRGDDGYITYAERSDGGAWRQWHYLLDDLVRALGALEPAGDPTNRYISINSFRRPQRSLDCLWRLNALYMDLDYHGADAPEGAPEAFLGYLEAEVFGAGLPTPSLVIKTGRGLQLLWLIEHLPRQAVPFWAVAQEAARARMERAAAAWGGPRPTVDNCADIARVFRLGGTFNTRAGKMAEMISYGDEPPVYRLDRLRDQWFPELKYARAAPQGAKPPKPPEGRAGAVARLFNQYTLHMARREDIAALARLRRAAHIPEDCRRRMVFLYRYWSCCALGDLDCALEDALRFNAGFLEPLRESVVATETRSAERAYLKWRAYQELTPEERAARGGRPGYNYKNATLIRLLGITGEEQRHLGTIIGREVKYARRNERAAREHWRHSRRDGRDRAGTTAKQRALSAERDYARRLAALGMRQRDIAQHMGLSLGKVNRLVKG